MSAARRSLLTATAAGTLLGALWFVPSAKASQETPVGEVSAPASAPAAPSAAATTTTTEDGTATEPVADSDGDQTQLADTGSIDTTPYVVGGTLFLGLGAGFVTYSVRRERTAAY
ncbi:MULTISPECIES: LPXTG cell wall anchor domain-containing protein [unclassified Streptomyces]|uniref:LPXTG cell wall anchor domain-containing protein n=1 Tax=unclassified Streptomyces TaxID=2593676 RepID=UPI0036525B06